MTQLDQSPPTFMATDDDDDGRSTAINDVVDPGTADRRAAVLDAAGGAATAESVDDQAAEQTNAADGDDDTDGAQDVDETDAVQQTAGSGDVAQEEVEEGAEVPGAEVSAAREGEGAGKSADDEDTDGAVDSAGAVDTDDGEPQATVPVRAAQLEREGEVAADFLERLLDIADLDGDIDVDIDGDRASVAIVDSEEGRVPRRLVGTDAKVLDALQELTRLAVQAATGERSRLMLDIAGHRATRRTELTRVAQQAVAQVNAGDARVALAPMSAFERKIIHDAVLAAGCRSQSEGVEPARYVVVLPA